MVSVSAVMHTCSTQQFSVQIFASFYIWKKSSNCCSCVFYLHHQTCVANTTKWVRKTVNVYKQISFPHRCNHVMNALLSYFVLTLLFPVVRVSHCSCDNAYINVILCQTKQKNYGIFIKQVYLLLSTVSWTPAKVPFTFSTCALFFFIWSNLSRK